jgi:hypothetical protein
MTNKDSKTEIISQEDRKNQDDEAINENPMKPNFFGKEIGERKA